MMPPQSMGAASAEGMLSGILMTKWEGARQ